jgi:hypothetical protein
MLTITESHGFRALVAAIISVIGVVRLLGRGLRNFACRSMQTDELDDGPSFWARILQGGSACARRVPVLWFDTREDAPVRLTAASVLCHCRFIATISIFRTARLPSKRALAAMAGVVSGLDFSRGRLMSRRAARRMGGCRV